MRGIRWCFRAANSGQAFGKYENDIEADFVKLATSSSVFWDVGANVGWFSLLASKLSVTTKIFAFEPDPSNLEYLKKHKALNDFQSITIIEKALGAIVGDAHFNASHQQGRLSDDGDLLVMITTADDVIKTNEAFAPDVIKLDIEGGEVDFLEGAETLLRKYQPRFLLSAHGYQKRDQCKEKLTQYGYSIKELVSNSVNGDYVLLAWVDNK